MHCFQSFEIFLGKSRLWVSPDLGFLGKSRLQFFPRPRLKLNPSPVAALHGTHTGRRGRIFAFPFASVVWFFHKVSSVSESA